MAQQLVRLALAAALIGACADEPEIFEWLRAGGGFVDPRQHFAVGENGVRGLFARAPIARGEVLLRVPWSMLIEGDEPGDACSTIHATHAALRRNDGAVTSGAGARFEPYLAVLDAHAMTLPGVWAPRERRVLLQGLPGARDARRHHAWGAGACGLREGETLGERALLLYVARSVGWTTADQQFHSGMVPVYDSYNHRNGRWLNVVYDPRMAGAFHMVARRDVAEGEQLYNSYGDGAPDIFRDYGFVEQTPARWWLDEGAPDGEGGGERDFTFVVDDGGAGAGRFARLDRPRAARAFAEAARRKQRELREHRERVRSELGVVDRVMGEHAWPHAELAFEFRAAYEEAVDLALAEAERLVAAERPEEL